MKIQRFLTVVALGAAMLVTAAGVSAQSRKSHGRLNLTADQKTQMHNIHAQTKAKMDELSKQSLTRQQFREQAAQIRQAQHQQIDSILTPEQRTQLAQRKGGRRAAARRRSQSV